MRLYQVIRFGAIDPVAIDLDTEVLFRTDDTFKSTEAFISSTKTDGEKYEGKEYRLLEERNKQVIMQVIKKPQYEICFTKEVKVAPVKEKRFSGRINDKWLKTGLSPKELLKKGSETASNAGKE